MSFFKLYIFIKFNVLFIFCYKKSFVTNSYFSKFKSDLVSSEFSNLQGFLEGAHVLNLLLIDYEALFVQLVDTN